MNEGPQRSIRLFRRGSLQRMDDARLLLEAGRTTGAVYLAGYGVECILKALLLAHVPVTTRSAVFKSFRGARAHDPQWLREEYRRIGGPPPPTGVAQAFTFVSVWTTDLRYGPSVKSQRDAERFHRACDLIIGWATGRLQ